MVQRNVISLCNQHIRGLQMQNKYTRNKYTCSVSLLGARIVSIQPLYSLIHTWAVEELWKWLGSYAQNTNIQLPDHLQSKVRLYSASLSVKLIPILLYPPPPSPAMYFQKNSQSLNTCVHFWVMSTTQSMLHKHISKTSLYLPHVKDHVQTLPLFNLCGEKYRVVESYCWRFQLVFIKAVTQLSAWLGVAWLYAYKHHLGDSADYGTKIKYSMSRLH